MSDLFFKRCLALTDFKCKFGAAKINQWGRPNLVRPTLSEKTAFPMVKTARPKYETL